MYSFPSNKEIISTDILYINSEINKSIYCYVFNVRKKILRLITIRHLPPIKHWMVVLNSSINSFFFSGKFRVHQLYDLSGCLCAQSVSTYKNITDLFIFS